MTTISPVVCECGREFKNSLALVGHKTSKAHKEWEANQAHEGETASQPMDETLVAAISDAKRGVHPKLIAPMVRNVFKRMDWPNDSHPGTVADFLVDHNIPIMDIPRGLNPDDARRWETGEMSRLKSEGYGTDQWVIKE